MVVRGTELEVRQRVAQMSAVSKQRTTCKHVPARTPKAMQRSKDALRVTLDFK